MGVKLPSQRKLLLGTKGCVDWISSCGNGDPWSEAEMKDSHQLVFALCLGFAS